MTHRTTYGTATRKSTLNLGFERDGDHLVATLRGYQGRPAMFRIPVDQLLMICAGLTVEEDAA